jgi:hypothetical protein
MIDNESSKILETVREKNEIYQMAKNDLEEVTKKLEEFIKEAEELLKAIRANKTSSGPRKPPAKRAAPARRESKVIAEEKANVESIEKDIFEESAPSVEEKETSDSHETLDFDDLEF